MWPNFTVNYSPNFSFSKRSKKKIKFIIIHYTGMNDESLAIKKLCRFNSNVSSHYFIKKNGEVLILVPDQYEAWHAGKSTWKKYISLNKHSIGIEIQNPGHENNYQNFSLNQINSLKALLKDLVKIYKISPKNILGHSDIAPDRKKDPGEKFPWKILAKNKLAHWHNLNENKLKKHRKIEMNINKENKFFKNLEKIGYKKKNSRNIHLNNKFLVKAFQRRFRQNLVDGKIDEECLLISENLIKY